MCGCRQKSRWWRLWVSGKIQTWRRSLWAWQHRRLYAMVPTTSCVSSLHHALLPLHLSFHLQTSTLHGRGVVLNCPCVSFTFMQGIPSHFSIMYFLKSFFYDQHIYVTAVRYEFFSISLSRMCQNKAVNILAYLIPFPMHAGKEWVQDIVTLIYKRLSECLFHM